CHASAQTPCYPSTWLPLSLPRPETSSNRPPSKPTGQTDVALLQTGLPTPKLRGPQRAYKPTLAHHYGERYPSKFAQTYFLLKKNVPFRYSAKLLFDRDYPAVSFFRVNNFGRLSAFL